MDPRKLTEETRRENQRKANETNLKKIIATQSKALRNLEGKNPKEVRTELLASSVKPSTLDSYASEVRKLAVWCHTPSAYVVKDGKIGLTGVLEANEIDIYTAEKGALCAFVGERFKKEDFPLFLAGHIGVAPISYRKLRCALILCQRMAMTDTWAADEDYVIMQKAACKLSQRVGARRGTLEGDMIPMLLEYARSKDPLVHEVMVVQMGGGFRIGEILRLRKEDIDLRGVVLVDEKRERVNRTNANRTPKSLKTIDGWTDGAKALKILSARAASRPNDDDRLYSRPEFSVKKYNSIIKSAAKELLWPDNLKFDGSHVLRHAGVRRAVRKLRAQGTGMVAITEALHMSLNTVLHYALSNDERLCKARKPAFLNLAAEEIPSIDTLDSENEDAELSDLSEHESEAEFERAIAKIKETQKDGKNAKRRRERSSSGGKEADRIRIAKETTTARRAQRAAARGGFLGPL